MCVSGILCTVVIPYNIIYYLVQVQLIQCKTEKYNSEKSKYLLRHEYRNIHLKTRNMKIIMNNIQLIRISNIFYALVSSFTHTHILYHSVLIRVKILLIAQK